jgi:DNA-binding XRE family transcriptional regulator
VRSCNAAVPLACRWLRKGDVPDSASPVAIGRRHYASALPSEWLEGRFADWLAERMAERQLTQRMVALRAGVDHATVSRLLRERRQPSLPTALALLRVLGPEPIRGSRFLREAS